MISTPTTFVVGAGGSAEVGLPVGSTLAAEVTADLASLHIDTLTGRPAGTGQLVRELERLSHRNPAENPGTRFRQLGMAARRIATGLPSVASLDTFIDIHRADPDVAAVAKLAMALRLHMAERKSSIFSKQSDSTFQRPIDVRQSWLHKFSEAFFGGFTFDELPSQLARISFVTFNYDRCIEHFLYVTTQRVFSVSPEQAKDALSNLRVAHVYGSLGDLPWQEDSGSPIGYGAVDEHPAPVALIGNLRTFTEVYSDPIQNQLINMLMSSGRRIVFLGFAYLNTNLERLRFVTSHASAPHVLGTSQGVSNDEIASVDVAIRSTFGGVSTCQLYDTTCADLFARARLRISS